MITVVEYTNILTPLAEGEGNGKQFYWQLMFFLAFVYKG